MVWFIFVSSVHAEMLHASSSLHTHSAAVLSSLGITVSPMRTLHTDTSAAQDKTGASSDKNKAADADKQSGKGGKEKENTASATAQPAESTPSEAPAPLKLLRFNSPFDSLSADTYAQIAQDMQHEHADVAMAEERQM